MPVWIYNIQFPQPFFALAVGASQHLSQLDVASMPGYFIEVAMFQTTLSYPDPPHSWDLCRQQHTVSRGVGL